MAGSPGKASRAASVTVLGRVELEIVLDPTLQLLALVGDDFARLRFERCCFDARGAGSRLDPLVHLLA